MSEFVDTRTALERELDEQSYAADVMTIVQVARILGEHAETHMPMTPAQALSHAEKLFEVASRLGWEGA